MGTEATPGVKFGINQINNPTPPLLKKFFRIFSFANGLIALLLISMPIPEHIKYVIVTTTGVGNTVIHYTIKFFGLQDAGFPEDHSAPKINNT